MINEIDSLSFTYFPDLFALSIYRYIQIQKAGSVNNFSIQSRIFFGLKLITKIMGTIVEIRTINIPVKKINNTL